MEDVGDLDEMDEDDNVFVPLRSQDKSADYYEETQRSFQELRIKMEEDSALAKQAMDRELEKLHRLFFRQDFLGTRERHQRRHRRRPAVSDTSSSSDTDTMASSRRVLHKPKPRSVTPGPRLCDSDTPTTSHTGHKLKRDKAKARSRLHDEEGNRKRLCHSCTLKQTSNNWTSKTDQPEPNNNVPG